MKEITFSPSRPLRIGTRGSPLALAQAREVLDRLASAHGLPGEAFIIIVIRTTGDKIVNRNLSQFGGKGLFTKELEEALQQGDIDIAVHSLKDVPTVLPDGFAISCVLPREDARDAFLSPSFSGFDALPKSSRIGTSSMRRRAQILHRRPDLNIVDFRGNVQTRLEKLNTGVVDATLLAVAGLNRLKLSKVPFTAISADEMLPAVAQGAIGIEQRVADDIVSILLQPVNDNKSQSCVIAERAFLKVLDGSCKTPIAGLAVINGERLHFRGEIIRPDGTEKLTYEASGLVHDAVGIGNEVANTLKGRGGSGFFH